LHLPPFPTRRSSDLVYRWPYARRSSWRRAVAVACSALLVVAMTAAWALLLLHIAYWRTPTPEPVSWSCPAEWVVMPGDTLWHIADRKSTRLNSSHVQ